MLLGDRPAGNAFVNASLPRQQWAIKADTRAFGNYIEADRSLVDLPHGVFVEVDMPEYARHGLVRMFARTQRYEFVDIGQMACEAIPLGADSSGAPMIYTDMHPTVLGSFAEVESRHPALAQALFERGLDPDLVALGVVRGIGLGVNPEHREEVSRLIVFLNTYRRRAAWMATHRLEVGVSNLEALLGKAAAFEWLRLYPDAEAAEI
jgi:hypothetical protein